MRSFQLREVTSLDDLPEPSEAVLEFIEAWKAARQGCLVPRKQDFDPSLVPKLLPHLWLYHYDEATDVFVCRLAGERINQAWGYPIAGKRSDQIFGRADNAAIVQIWWRILGASLLHYGKEERLSGNALYAAERIVAPLADAAGRRNFMLSLSLYALGGEIKYLPPMILEQACRILCRHL